MALNSLGRIQQHTGRKKPRNVSMSYKHKVTFKKVISHIAFSRMTVWSISHEFIFTSSRKMCVHYFILQI